MELLTNKLSSAGHAEALERLNLSDSGTIVLWEEMDKKPWRLGNKKTLEALTKKISDLREHLSMIFYRYVSGKNNFDREVTIRVHDSPLDELDPL